MNAPVLTNSSGDPTDTLDPSAPVPDDPTARPSEQPTAHPNPAPDAGHEPPAAPIPLGPVAGPLGPVAGGWMPPPPPPGPPAPPQAPGAGGGAWEPISTPYGLAWGPHPIPPVPSAATRRHPRFFAVTAIVVVLSVLAGVGVGYAVWKPSGNGTTNVAANNGTSQGSGSGTFTPPSGSGSSGNGSSGSGSSATSAAVAAKVDPGLVDINVTLSYQGESAAGTGQVLTSSGEVLTNNHVVDGATSISVTDIGNGRTYSASVVGYDRTGDLAVIQLHGASGLSTVSVGDSSKVTVGQTIIAIGNAGGVGGTPSVAGGTVTTLNQAITASDDGGGNSEQLTGLIEVNANVQPGDSGGPLVNTAGQVVGIDTAASESFSFSSAGGDGYAIPIDTAISIAKHIEAGKSSSTVHVGPTAFLGVEISSVNSVPGLGGQSGSSVVGADVAGVAFGSPAQAAGLAQGDVITSLAGQTVTSPTSLSTIIAGHSPGNTVQVQWVDASGAQHTATVQLASGPAT